ncbi:unnamed protein product [Lampetra fluviatilis]
MRPVSSDLGSSAWMGGCGAVEERTTRFVSRARATEAEWGLEDDSRTHAAGQSHDHRARRETRAGPGHQQQQQLVRATAMAAGRD